MAPTPPRQPPDDYEVGYGKPPTQARFKKGVSGNPLGRRARTIRSTDERILEQKVTIAVDGKRRSVPLAEALGLVLGQKAMTGDMKAMREVLRMKEQLAKTRSDGEGEAPRYTTGLFINGVSGCTSEALRILEMIKGNKISQLLEPWVVEVGLARLGRRLNDIETEVIRTAMYGSAKVNK